MTNFKKMMVLLILVPCLALMIGCTGDTGPFGRDGLKGDTGNKGEDGKDGDKGDPGKDIDYDIVCKVLGCVVVDSAEALREALEGQGREVTILITEDIDDFFNGATSGVKTLASEAGNLLQVNSSGYFEYYVVDPLVINGNVNIIGVPFMDGGKLRNPYINGSVRIESGNVTISNLDIIPDIPVCTDDQMDYQNSSYNIVTDYVCHWPGSEYAGLVVMKGSLDMYDSAIDMKNAAKISITKDGKRITAQPGDSDYALNAVYVDPIAKATFDDVEVSNTYGKYGLAADLKKIDIAGGSFEGADNSLYLTLTDTASINLTPAAISITEIEKITGEYTTAVKQNGTAAVSQADLPDIIANLFALYEVTTAGAIGLSDLDDLDFGVVFDDVVLDEYEADFLEDLATLTSASAIADAINDEAEDLENLIQAIEDYAKYLTLVDILSDTLGSTIEDKIDDMIEGKFLDAIEAKLVKANEAAIEAMFKTKAKGANVAPNTANDAVIAWSYEYTYDADDADVDADYDYSFAYSFAYTYTDPLSGDPEDAEADYTIEDSDSISGSISYSAGGDSGKFEEKFPTAADLKDWLK